MIFDRHETALTFVQHDQRVDIELLICGTEREQRKPLEAPGHTRDITGRRRARLQQLGRARVITRHRRRPVPAARPEGDVAEDSTKMPPKPNMMTGPKDGRA
jgi:hypothetical protein